MYLQDGLRSSARMPSWLASRWWMPVWLLLTLLCAGCTTVAPVDEVRLFSKAFDTFDGASQPLLDDLATAERSQGRSNAATRAKKNQYTGDCAEIRWASAGANMGFIEGFCIDDAPYFTEIGDPPATRVFRRGISLLGEYINVLLILAEGRNLDEATAQVQTLGERIAALISPAPGAGTIGVGLTEALGALIPIIRDAARAKNIEEMKRLVVEGAPPVKQLIVSLRRAAPEFFNTITSQSVQAATSSEALDNQVVAKMSLDRISAYRIAVSNYVSVLDELQRSFDQLVITFQRPHNTVSLAAIAQVSAQLTAHAEAWRKVYSLLRTSIQ